MGWRDSYESLLELFPQVDTRLIKGAALEHGSDVAAAAEFILNEIVEQEEENSATEPQSELQALNNALGFVEPLEGWDADKASFEREFGADGSSSSIPVAEPVKRSADEQQEPVTAFESGAFAGEPEQTEQKDLFPTAGEPEQAEQKDLFPTYIDSLPDSDPRWLSLSELEFAERFIPHHPYSPRSDSEDDDGVQLLIERALEDGVPQLDSFAESSPELVPVEESLPELVPVEESLPELVPVEESVPELVPVDESLPELGPVEESLPELVPVEESLSELIFLEGELSSNVESALLSRNPEQGGEENWRSDDHPEKSVEEPNFTDDDFPIYDGSISVAESVCDDGNAVALDDGLGSMLSIQESDISEEMSIQESDISEEMDRGDWENINSTAITSITQLNQMEPLDNLVEEAKADKEALIGSIEEIRVLRLMTDQAEYDARESREAATRGGTDLMAKVTEMRKLLSRARDTNAVHAGEVFGEKAVLVTEARELQQRLAQVNSEKAKAVAALNQIKASLQARIQTAIREKEASEQERVQREESAKAALAKEEALVAKVAQESRDLEAEAETCSKFRDFLIERGSIVDALQGEVAVLREDAESLKKDLESMSLSYGGSAFHNKPLLSQTGSEIYNSMLSGSGRPVLFGDMGDTDDSFMLQLEKFEKEDPSATSSTSAALNSVRASGVQKFSGDKKSWSSLPSLLRGMSGSQDLSGSGHSGYSSTVSNSVSSLREAPIANQGDKSQGPSGANSLMEMKYPSTPTSPPRLPESVATAEEEWDRLKVTMAMFPDEEAEIEYSGGHNLDVFRAVKTDGSDDEDWQLLEKGSSTSSSRSCVGN